MRLFSPIVALVSSSMVWARPAQEIPASLREPQVVPTAEDGRQTLAMSSLGGMIALKSFRRGQPRVPNIKPNPSRAQLQKLQKRRQYLIERLTKDQSMDRDEAECIAKLVYPDVGSVSFFNPPLWQDAFDRCRGWKAAQVRGDQAQEQPAQEENARRDEEDRPQDEFRLPKLDPAAAARALTAYRPPAWNLQNAIEGFTAHASQAGSVVSRMKIPVRRIKVIA